MSADGAAGQGWLSTSQRWIYRYCKEHDVDVDYEDRNEYATMLNQGVLRRLNHAYWKKHNMNDYVDPNARYSSDLVNPEIRIINA